MSLRSTAALARINVPAAAPTNTQATLRCRRASATAAPEGTTGVLVRAQPVEAALVDDVDVDRVADALVGWLHGQPVEAAFRDPPRTVDLDGLQRVHAPSRPRVVVRAGRAGRRLPADPPGIRVARVRRVVDR